MRDLARKLLAASQTASDTHMHEVVRACESLGIPIKKFAGVEGFASLMRRALALAGAEVPSLQSVKIGADGCPGGFEGLGADTGTGPGEREAAVAVTAHLLGLLVTFIGEPLTMRLVRDAWPDASWDESD